MNFFHPEIPFVMKPLFSGLLTNIIDGEQSEDESVLFHVQKYDKHADPSVTGFYLDILECYIMPILQNKALMAYCLNKTGHPCICTTK
jgi:hypothetical protein